MKLDTTFRHHADTNGSSLQGYIRTTYNDIVKVLGKPYYADDDNKVTAEWAIKFIDGPLATIYDWKEEQTPMGEYDWHIGGKSKNAVLFIKELFESAGIDAFVKEA